MNDPPALVLLGACHSSLIKTGCDVFGDLDVWMYGSNFEMVDLVDWKFVFDRLGGDEMVRLIGMEGL